ncbi:MAG: O-methyltransferase [Chloroflexota bacterium]
MTDRLSFPAVQDYLATLVPPRPPEMQAMERYADEHDFPIIGPVAGYQCYQIARMVAAQRIFEMGSGYGYSTAWFARAVRETCAGQGQNNGCGVVHHTVWDAALSEMAAGHLSRMGFDGLIEYHVAEAVETLESTPGPFDLIFNDINKEAYPASLPVIKDKLRPGGVLIIDNMLWSGRIFDPADRSGATAGVREFTRRITADPDWIVTLSPVRDGMIIAYKK